MLNEHPLWIKEVQRKLFRCIVLDFLVIEMLPHLPEPERQAFTLRYRGVDTAARGLYDAQQVNKPNNGRQTTSNSAEREGHMPDEEE